MHRVLWIFLLLWICRPVMAQSFLRTMVRDFSEFHPDMQRPIDFNVFEPDLGIVQERLSDDWKPVFNEAGGPFATVTTPENFDQWYRHVDGVNTNIALALRNQSTGGGFSYADESFFPIDDILFGNEFYFHNFHFTMESRGVFTYEPGATAGFIGDDDFWLFINDELAIDLGGVHDRLVQSVELDELGLTPGETYPIHFFFAERHTAESRFIFETSFEIRQADGDVDGDGRLDKYDLDELCRYGLADGIQWVGYDLNSDNRVNSGDLSFFLSNAQSLRGDVDLDGTVSFADFLIVSANFGSENAFWSQGDLDCDTTVGFEDFLTLSSQFGKSHTAAASVPEPQSGVMMLLTVATLFVHRRARYRVLNGA